MARVAKGSTMRLRTASANKKEMRFTAAGANGGANSALSNAIGRALQSNGGWSIKALRQPGIDLMDQVEFEDGYRFRAAAPMADKAQVQIDKAVVEVGLQRLTVAADILAAGLTYNLADPLSVAQLEWNAISKVGAAQRTMQPRARGENKLPLVAPSRLPIYLTTDQFELDIRTLKTSQRMGTPLDTALVKQCVRAVNEAIEDAVINGATTLDGANLVVAGYSAPGLLNAPGVNTTNLTKAAWSGPAAVGSTVFGEVMTMIGLLQAKKKFGPYRLYVPTVIGNALASDYNATNNAQGLTIAQRLLNIDGLQAIRVADLLPIGTVAAGVSTGGKVVLVQMTSDVVDIVVGQPPTVIPWTSLDGYTIHNLIMAIMVPRVRTDYDGSSGIAVGTLA